MGSDFVRIARYSFRCAVSIHTPAWGVTTLTTLIPLAGDVSIHTPAWGVTAGLNSS